MDQLRTLWRLGPTNVARVALYRVGLKTGLHPVVRISASVPEGPFFAARNTPPPAGAKARNDWCDQGLGFGHVPISCADGPPDWHANILGGGRAADSLPWYRIPDFDPAVGDIKGVWEASRFDWLIAMAQRAALGDRGELDRLNRWLDNWARANPPYLGANWKCAQEASIRVLHLALAAIILDQTDAPLPGLMQLLRAHLTRIEPTTGYAVAQDNNHGTSEAAALFVGGSWLERLGLAEGKRPARLGRRLLAERAHRLIMPDGSFSQYSLVYHRMMLDTYSFAESWRRRLELPASDPMQRERTMAATRWLQQMVDPATGDGPNLGANDSAQLLTLEEAGYRDFRPSLQWAAALFLEGRAVPSPGVWNQRLRWLGIDEPPEPLPAPISTQLDDGGYHVLRRGSAMACLRYPRFRFRPSQADALHVDLWIGGENMLRDGGTFSYNGSAADTGYFGGTASHNTAMFDGRDQMPRLGRFLFGHWLSSSVAEFREDVEAVTARAAYTDHLGATHDRTIRLTDGKLEITDRMGGQAREVAVRWRLAPGNWELDSNCLQGRSQSVRVELADANQSRPTLALVEGAESRYYGSRSALPVLEARLTVPSTLITTIEF